MTFKQFRNKPFVKFISNRYVIILLIFIVWMLFFDENSYFIHRDVNKELNQIVSDTTYFRREINKDKKEMSDLKNPDSLEKFAREKYHMKRKDEDIYIIEFDTLKKNE
ncbi:MAG: septum formation initiator family protein [Flavobacteriaceae bacterium]|nr:septum formation initiator family protein [Flavobacteriaceae bacterium]